jgi:glutaminase
MNGASLRHWVARALIEVNGAPSAHLLRTGLSLALYPVSMPASPIQNYLDGLLARLAPLSAGRVADYIPELQLANPDWFGICIATHDGHVYEVGDARQPFTIQSISKPLSYGLALEQQGEAAVLARIGVEPSGDAFNAISLHPRTGTPLNPLINAGAIATCGLVRGRSAAEKMAHILDTFSRYAGRQLDIDERIYRSESETGHRNRAIGWMLRNFGVLEDDPTATLEAYFQQCSIRVTCRDLALMGATLANGGVNPLTGVRAIRAELCQQCPLGDGHLRHVRRLGRVDVPHRPAGQERGGRRHPGGAAGPAGDRGVFAAPRCPGQQCARGRGVPGTGIRPGAAPF